MKKQQGKEVIEHMGSVNKVTLVGNLTRNPEMKQSEGKKPTCTFGLAPNRYWTDERGEKHEEPEYHRIVAWDKLAERCHQFLRKGRKAYLEGRLQTRPYTGQDGIEKYATEIVLEELVMLDKLPEDVKDTIELKDASNDAPSQQIY
jgi:single-strand DNA-binding protein